MLTAQKKKCRSLTNNHTKVQFRFSILYGTYFITLTVEARSSHNQTCCSSSLYGKSLHKYYN